jgi:hypothetical protein
MTFDATMSLLDPRPGLVRLRSLTVDASQDPQRARHLVRLGQALYTFWHTGKENWLHEAVDPSFTDRPLLPGRPQGIKGPAAASATFRAAVPDRACDLAELLVVRDKLAVRLRVTGHFTGTFNGIAARASRSTSSRLTSSMPAPDASSRTGISRTT